MRSNVACIKLPCCPSPNASKVCFVEIPIQCGAVIMRSDSTVSLNTPHSSPRSKLHCVSFVRSLFLYFFACWRGMAAGGSPWCCCPCAFGRGHASMARSGVGNHGLDGICGCLIRVALGWGTSAVVPVLATTTTSPVAWFRFHCCLIVIYFPNMFICVACVKWVHTNIYMFMSTRFSSGIEYPGLAFPPSAAYVRQSTWLSLVQVMACRLFGATPLPELMLLFLNRTLGNKFSETRIWIISIPYRIYIW